ncbi:MAG: sortase [Eubacteriales bacterium]
MKKKLSGNILIFCGCLCILAGAGIYANNQKIDKEGEKHCSTITSEFQTLVESSPSEQSPEDSILTSLRSEVILINGDLYIGLLEIPSLDITLPIYMDMTAQNLTNAPCVYEGSLSENNLVIAGHNYRSHFWDLRYLEKGAQLSITNPNGRVYHYVVEEKELVHERDLSVLEDRGDLMLFTCNYPDNNYRIVLQCEKTMGF